MLYSTPRGGGGLFQKVPKFAVVGSHFTGLHFGRQRCPRDGDRLGLISLATGGRFSTYYFIIVQESTQLGGQKYAPDENGQVR